jgi:imidazolonepropionase-like amidohydrolase
MDGFTTIREAGGADYSIARRLAEGAIVGPRLFYSGRALTQTGGGADFRTPAETNDACGHASPFSVMSVIVDGVDEVRRAAREELRRGAPDQALRLRRGRVPIGIPCNDLRVLGRRAAGPEAQKSQLREFETRAGLDSPAAVIRSATATNAELLMLKHKLGVIAPGAYADLLVVDGDPLTDLRVMTDPQRNLKVIMKDGVFYMNELG